MSYHAYQDGLERPSVWQPNHRITDCPDLVREAVFVMVRYCTASVLYVTVDLSRSQLSVYSVPSQSPYLPIILRIVSSPRHKNTNGATPMISPYLHVHDQKAEQRLHLNVFE